MGLGWQASLGGLSCHLGPQLGLAWPVFDNHRALAQSWFQGSLAWCPTAMCILALEANITSGGPGVGCFVYTLSTPFNSLGNRLENSRCHPNDRQGQPSTVAEGQG